MLQGYKISTICLIALVLASSSLPGTVSAWSTGGISNRKLLQPVNPSNIASNTLRAQAATSQSIEEAVLRGAGTANVRRAGVTGVATSWASGQRQDVFNAVDFAASPTSGRGWGK